MQQDMKLSQLLPRGLKKELARQFDRDEHSVNPMLDGVFASETARALRVEAINRATQHYQERLARLSEFRDILHTN